MNPSPENSENQQYQVVALKYRPQEFGSLIGQGHIATALSNAIKQNRVGHAYLFTGARGVGKTSSARIFAKCLNCEKGPTNTPCNECDICQAVSSGEDVDVLEIDGASNRGIDEIRQLRSNASVRPSRSKYKIYIIDEVHMLTMQAFNALLKTLEEPPLHVKFIFCTTDPQKIPITVLSRCQRFDFSPVQTNEIASSLKNIAESEGVKADEEALALLARRANGSMRDSQSLLEQLFSFCGDEITVDEVHQLLGTADMGRIANVASALADTDANAALTLINQGALDGVDSGQMAEQLLGYFRDMMAVRVGCGEDTLLNCTASDLEQLQSLAESLGLETILMIVQLLDAAVVRMQSSLHGRTLLEVAAIRICNLEKLDSIPDLVESLSKSGGAPRSSPKPNPSRKPRVEMRQVNSGKDAVKKNDELSSKAVSSETVAGAVATAAAGVGAAVVANRGGTSVAVAASPTGQSSEAKVASAPKSPTENGSVEANSTANAASATVSESTSSVASASSVTADNLESIWKSVIERIDGVTKEMAASFESLDLKEPGHLVVTLENRVSKDVCSKADKKQAFENLLNEITGETISVEFAASKNTVVRSAPAPKMSRPQQIRLLHENEFVKQAMSLFDAEIVEYHEPVPTKKR